MEQILNQFGVKPILLLAQAINFFILLLILKKFLYKPLLGVLQKRKEIIQKSLQNAEEIEKKLLKTEEDREKRLEDAIKEAKTIVTDAQKSAEEIVAEAHLKALSDIAQLLQKGQESINQDREKMQQQLKLEIAGLIASSLEKVIESSLDSTSKKKIVDKAIANL